MHCLMELFYASTISEWREWLIKNHLTKSVIHLVKFKKHTGKPSLSSKEALIEATCFGWVDTVIKRLDEDRYVQKFVKRKKSSRWSKNTLSYAQQLIKDGKMTLAGLKAYELGLKKFKRSEE